MKNIALILAILLIFSLLGNFIQFRDQKQDEIYRLNTELQFQALLQDKNKHLATLDSLLRTIRAKDSLDIAYYLEVANRSKMRNSNLTKEIAKLRSEVQPQIDTIPAIKHYIEMQYLSLAQKDSLIQVLGNQIAEQVQNCTEISEIQDEQIQLERQKAEMWMGQAANFQNLYKKADDQAKKRWTIGPVVAYGVGNNGLTPFFGVGVGYSLVRF